MNIGEILRKLADLIDQDQPQEVGAPNEPTADTMVSPLQQKHELLKKATGVENEYDSGVLADKEIEVLKALGIDIDQLNGTNEINAIKRDAGIPVTAIIAAADDYDVS